MKNLIVSICLLVIVFLLFQISYKNDEVKTIQNNVVNPQRFKQAIDNINNSLNDSLCPLNADLYELQKAKELGTATQKDSAEKMYQRFLTDETINFCD